MTEKRFIIADDYAILDSTQNNEIGKGIYVAQDPVEATKLCKLLNELAEENQLLLKASEKDSKLIKTLRKAIHQWRKENEQLKEENRELRSDRDYWKTISLSLAKNNGNVKLKDEHLAWKRVDVE